jgi:hypothetical protein
MKEKEFAFKFERPEEEEVSFYIRTKVDGVLISIRDRRENETISVELSEKEFKLLSNALSQIVERAILNQ